MSMLKKSLLSLAFVCFFAFLPFTMSANQIGSHAATKTLIAHDHGRGGHGGSGGHWHGGGNWHGGHGGWDHHHRDHGWGGDGYYGGIYFNAYPYYYNYPYYYYSYPYYYDGYYYGN